MAIFLGTQQAQASKHALQAADIGAIVTEPQRSSSVLVRWQSSCMAVVVAQGPEHEDIELVHASTQFGETTADRPYLDRCLVCGGHLPDELVELLSDSGVLGEQLSLQLEARGFSEVGVDQREVSVEVVVPDSKDGAIVGQFSVEGGGLERLSRQPCGGPEDESHSVQALVEK
jgi:hypothetical protein